MESNHSHRLDFLRGCIRGGEKGKNRRQLDVREKMQLALILKPQQQACES